MQAISWFWIYHVPSCNPLLVLARARALMGVERLRWLRCPPSQPLEHLGPQLLRRLKSCCPHIRSSRVAYQLGPRIFTLGLTAADARQATCQRSYGGQRQRPPGRPSTCVLTYFRALCQPALVPRVSWLRAAAAGGFAHLTSETTPGLRCAVRRRLSFRPSTPKITLVCFFSYHLFPRAGYGLQPQAFCLWPHGQHHSWS